MIFAILRFSFARYFRKPSIYVYFVLFSVLSCLLMMVSANAWPATDVHVGLGGNIKVNSPFGIFVLTALMYYLAMLPLGAIAGRAAAEDFHANVHEFFFTTRVSKAAYLGGRLLAAVAVSLVVLASIGAGLFAGTHMPLVDRALIGPNRLLWYVWPYLLMVIPNVAAIGAIFFCIAALTRRMLAVYAAIVVMIAGYMTAAALQLRIENHWIDSVLDPTGFIAFTQVTNYWTAFDRGSRLVPLSYDLLMNRVVWIATAIVVLAFTLWRFRFEYQPEGFSARGTAAEEAPAMAVVLPKVMPARVLDFSFRCRALAVLIWWDFRYIVRSVWFAVMLLAGLAFFAAAARTMGSLWGTPTYPVTYQIAELVQKHFAIAGIAVITFYSGQLVWRERNSSIHEIAGVLPVSEWTFVLGKTAALIAVQIFLVGFAILAGMAIQLAKGYTRLEPLVYLKLLGLDLVSYCLLCVLAVVLQIAADHKHLGFFALILFYAVSAFLPSLGLDQHIYNFSSSPDVTYSDMNGFGHVLRAVFWHDLYWSACAVLLVLGARLLWVRGLASGWRWRLILGRERFGALERRIAAGASAVFLGSGCFIFYNTHLLNTYRGSREEAELRVRYEKEFAAYKATTQPRITAVKLNIDLYPERRSVRIRGAYDIINRSAVPIEKLFVGVSEALRISRLDFSVPATREFADTALEIFIYRLQRPLPPGAAATVEFELESHPRGFPNDGVSPGLVIANGTFFNSGILPHFGYNEENQVSDNDKRRKYGLPPLPGMPDPHDTEALRKPDFPRDADWMTFEAVISTSSDQIALAPGELLREWTEGNRRYYHYRTLGQVRNLFAVLSARYRVLRDRWRGVELAIYYHPGHEYNLGKMMQGLKESLEYCTRNFSPYQNKTIRIAEFPRYATFAQSLPATIPYSESIGFIARVDPKNPNDVDYPFYITAHEVAHQWWAHQLAAAGVKGARMLSESLAQYTALMVMKREFGADRLNRFLTYEVDQYLKGRAKERFGEPPLAGVELESYVYYNKGSIAFYTLQDAIGEGTINRVLRDYLQQAAYRNPPYPTARELVERLRAAAPPDRRQLVQDLFESITLYESGIEDGSFKAVSGRYDVVLKLTLQKFKADSDGAQTRADLADSVDVALFGAHDKLLASTRVAVSKSPMEVRLTAQERPAKAVLDPWYKLLERNRHDNSYSFR